MDQLTTRDAAHCDQHMTWDTSKRRCCLLELILQGGTTGALMSRFPGVRSTQEEFRLRAIRLWGVAQRRKFTGALVA